MKEPALSDGRLQPGDKLLAANGVELASFSHQEVIFIKIRMMLVMISVAVLPANVRKDAPTHCHQVVQFLRQCPDTVSLELYRDASRSQTPLSPEQVGLAWSFSEFAKENFLCGCAAV